MTKICFLSVFSFFFLFTCALLPVEAQVSVEWTNQLFAGKTAVGQNVLAFIYPDGIDFVYRQEGSYRKVRVRGNFSSESMATDFFIAGNTFCFRKRRTVFVLDLANILMPSNYERDLTFYLIDEISGVDSLHVYNNMIYYLKSGRILRYNQNEKNRPIDDVLIANSSLSYLAFNPVSSRYSADYEMEKNRISGILDSYNAIANETRGIENIERATQSQQTAEGLYNMVKPGLLAAYPVNPAAFAKFFSLAALLRRNGDNGDAVNTVKVLEKRNSSPLSFTIIHNYYRALDEYRALNRPGVLADRKKTIGENYDREAAQAAEVCANEKNDAERNYIINLEGIQRDMISRFGNNFEQKYNDLLVKETSLNGYNWVGQNRNQDMEYSSNIGKLAALDNFLVQQLSIDSVSALRAGCREYRAKKDMVDHLESARQEGFAGYDKQSLINLRLQNAREVFSAQKELGRKALDAAAGAGVTGRSVPSWTVFKTEYGKFKAALENISAIKQTAFDDAEKKRKGAVEAAEKRRDAEFAAVERQLGQDKDNAASRRDNNLKTIASSLLNRFINDELLRQIMEIRSANNIPSNQYDSGLADFCVIAESLVSIQGFKVPLSITMRHFEAPRNNSGELFRFAKPQSYSIISAFPNSVYVLASEDTIFAYDLTKLNLLSNPGRLYSVGEKVFYLLKSDINQYMVTKTGGLYRLEIVNNTVRRSEKLKDVRGTDTVVISTISGKDEIYILGQDGLVNGRQTGVVRFSTGTDTGYVTLVVENRQFRVQE